MLCGINAIQKESGVGGLYWNGLLKYWNHPVFKNMMFSDPCTFMHFVW